MQQRSRSSVSRFLPLFMLSLIGINGCGSEVKQHAEQAKLQTVEAVKAEAADHYFHNQTYTGTVKAGQTTAIGFELGGKLQQLLVDSGTKVKQGQPLASLDTHLLMAEKQQLQASLEQTKADLALARNTQTRTTKLKAQNYVSEQQIDEANQNVAGLNASLKRLEASLYATNLKLEKSTLVAPVSGIISKRHHNLGEVIPLGGAVFTLIGDQHQFAYVGVPIHVAQSLTNQQDVTVRIGKQSVIGKVEGISGEVDLTTRTIELRISLPTDVPAVNGELVYFEHQQKIDESGFWLPITAITDGVRGRWNVYTLTPSEQNDFQIERRDIEILYTQQDKVFIKGPINAGEQIIARGLHKLVVGQNVLLANQTTHSAKANEL